MTILEYFLVPFYTVETRDSKKSTHENCIFSEKIVKNQNQEWFFNNSGNGYEKSDREKPSYTYIVDQNSIAFSSKMC